MRTDQLRSGVTSARGYAHGKELDTATQACSMSRTGRTRPEEELERVAKEEPVIRRYGQRSGRLRRLPIPLLAWRRPAATKNEDEAVRLSPIPLTHVQNDSLPLYRCIQRCAVYRTLRTSQRSGTIPLSESILHTSSGL